MNTWIAGKDLMKNYYLTSELFTWKTLQMLITDIQKKYSKTLIIKI